MKNKFRKGEVVVVDAKWKTMWSCENNQDVGLEAAIHLKSAS